MKIKMKMQLRFCGSPRQPRSLVFTWLPLIFLISLASTGHAQERENMTQVTCANYLAMSPDLARLYSAWMSGWYNQKFGYTTIGLDDYGRSVASVRQWCTDNPQATVMAALDHSVPQPGPPTGQIKLEMALVTCKQFLSADADRQDMIAYWMSGYFRASRSQPIIDFWGSTNTQRAVAKYCKKHGNETVMSAIQNGR